MRELFVLLVLGTGAYVGEARAAGPDFSSVVSGVDFAAVALAVLAIAALMVVVAVVRWGAARVLAFFDSGDGEYAGDLKPTDDGEWNPYEGGYWENGVEYDEDGRRV